MARAATAAVRLLTGEREPVYLATTANITLEGLQTIDGVLTPVGKRVLVKDQTDATTNGIYPASEGVWQRASDARTSRTMQKGTTVHVQAGSTNAGKVYSFQTDDPDIGTDDIVLAFYTSDDILGDVNDAITAGVTSIETAESDALGDIDAAKDQAIADIASAEAENIDFTATGTGATTRSVADRLREIVSVKDFGAVGDGVTDDTAAFSAAALAAPEFWAAGPPNNTTTVPLPEQACAFVPAGNYNLSSLVDVGNKDFTWYLDPGARFAGVSDANYLNGRVFRPGLGITHGYPSGILNQAGGWTASLGGGYSDKPAPVTGVYTLPAFAAYLEGDKTAVVALAGAAYSQPVLIDTATATYTATTATIPLLTSDEQKRLRVGMLIETEHASPFAGVLVSWAHGADTVLTVETGWYEIALAGASTGTPADGTGLIVNRFEKLWPLNIVMNFSADGAATDGIGSELSLRNLKVDSDLDIDLGDKRIWGYGAFAGAHGTPGWFSSQVGMIVKGDFHYAYHAVEQDVGYNYRCTGTGKTAFKARMPSTEIFFDGEEAGTGNRRYRITGAGNTEHGDPAIVSAAGRTISFFTSGNSVAYDSRIHATGGSASLGQGTLTFNAVNNLFGGVVRPTQDNVFSLGATSFRWSEVFAGNGTINTSDETLKEQIGAIPDEWLDAWGAVEWRRYKFNDAVAAKGDQARWHVGLIAQQIERTFAEKGIDAFAIGLLCRDPVTKMVTKTRTETRPVCDDREVTTMHERLVDGAMVRTPVTKMEKVPRQVRVPVLNEDGTPFMEEQLDPSTDPDAKPRLLKSPAYRMMPVTETVEVEYQEEVTTDEWRYGVRYDEAQAMEAAWMRRALGRMKAST